MTKPWYEAAFGADYMKRYAHRDDREAKSAVRTFIDRADLPEGSRVLDFCCGAGRHMAILAEEAMDVYGMDLSRDLLREAADLFVEPPLARADMRRVPFADHAFDAVTHFFTAFGYFETDEENLSVFDEIARVLCRGGVYLFDFLSAPAVIRQFEATAELHNVEQLGGNMHLESTRRLTAGAVRVEKEMRFEEDGRIERTITESVRLFRPETLREALNKSGFDLQEEWGDYKGTPYEESEATRWVALARRR
ncbi:class I SAM-dependent methyltransferase [bacterium]|nr:class I SAM-dependent methyltransferase [bacterium]